MRPLFVARLPRVSMLHRSSKRSLRAPHALVEVVRSCSDLLSILLSAAFLHEDLVAEVLVRSENASTIYSCTRATVLAVEKAQPLGFSGLSYLGLLHLVCQHEVRVLFEGVVDVSAQIDVGQIVHDHWLGGQLAQEQILILPTLPEELVLDLYVEVSLNGAHEQGRILRWRCDDLLEDLLALQVVDFAVPEESLLHLAAQIDDGVNDWQCLEPREEEPDERLVEDMLLL